MSVRRENAHRALDLLLDAIEQDRAANSDEARAKTEAAVVAARNALDRLSGLEAPSRGDGWS